VSNSDQWPNRHRLNDTGAVVKAIDRTIGKVHVTLPGGAADSTSQRGSPDCVRCSIRLMSKSQVSLNVYREAVVIDAGRVVIVFVALGVSAYPVLLGIGC